MKIPSILFKWGISLYPPLFFNRIRPVKISKDFSYLRVKVAKSIFNRNLNGTTFGGTIGAAFDPWHGILYRQRLMQIGLKTRVWVKSLSVRFLKPADSHLYIDIWATNEDILQTSELLHESGKTIRTIRCTAVNREGTVCAEAEIEIYLKLLV